MSIFKRISPQDLEKCCPTSYVLFHILLLFFLNFIRSIIWTWVKILIVTNIKELVLKIHTGELCRDSHVET